MNPNGNAMGVQRDASARRSKEQIIMIENSTPAQPEPTFTTITASEAAALLGIHITTLYAAARRREIPCRIIGRRFVFVRETILDWMARDTTAS
jgi:excisionase family DNA binding protein